MTAISGYLFLLDRGAISWSSKKQGIIALLTTEAEYVMLMQAAKKAIWLQSLPSDMLSEFASLMMLYRDNQFAIVLNHNHQYRAQTKHINICFYLIWWIVAEDNIKLVYCLTEDMVVDILTKALPSLKVRYLTSSLGLRKDWGGVLEHTIYLLSSSLPDYLLLGQLAILVLTITSIYHFDCVSALLISSVVYGPLPQTFYYSLSVVH